MKRFFAGFLCFIFCINLLGLSASALTVPEGTEITLSPVKTVTSKNPDTTVKAFITEDVVVDGVTVFKADDKAYVTISDYEKAGAFGTGGELILGNGYAYDTKGVKHKILLSRKIEGRDKNWVRVTCAAGIILWPLLLFGFVRGNQAKLQQSATLDVTTSSPFEF